MTMTEGVRMVTDRCDYCGDEAIGCIGGVLYHCAEHEREVAAMHVEWMNEEETNG